MSERLATLFSIINHIDCQINDARRGLDAIQESNINSAREVVKLIVDRLPHKYGVRNKYDRVEWSDAEPIKHLAEVIEWLKRPNISQRLPADWLDDKLSDKLAAAHLTELMTQDRLERLAPTRPTPAPKKPVPKKATQLAPGLYRLVVIDSTNPDDDVERMLNESMVFDDDAFEEQ